MQHKGNNTCLSISIETLNSLLPFVILASLIDPKIAVSLLSPICSLSQLFTFILFCVLIVLHVYIYSGVYGSIVEVASGQELLITYRSIRINACRYWTVYLLLSSVQVVLHFFLYLLFPPEGIPFSFVRAYLNMPFSFFFLYFILRDKYISPMGLPLRRLKLTSSDFFAIICIYAIALGITYMAFYSFSLISGLLIFCMKYIYFLSWIFIAYLILKSYPEIGNSFFSGKQLFLIRPPIGGGFISLAYSIGSFYPLEFVVQKALTPADYRIKEFNQILWHKRYYMPGVLVSISGCSDSIPEAYKIAKEFKKLGAKVVMSGMHVSFLPEEALEFCDTVIIGDLEGIWRQVIHDYECNSLKRVYHGGLDEDSRMQVHKYLLEKEDVAIVRNCIETSYGCKYNCDFCPIFHFCSGKVRKKPVVEVVELIRKVRKRYRWITFADNNIYNDPAYAIALFKAIKPLGVRWNSFCSVDIARDENALRLAKESGCWMLNIGYEIHNTSMEKDKGGKLALAENYIQLTKKIKKAGIFIRASFIFGFDTDNIKSLFYLWLFCLRIRPLFTLVSLLVPRPGADLFWEMLAQKRIFNYNWRDYVSINLLFEPKDILIKRLFLIRPLFLFISLFFLLTTSLVGYIVIGCILVSLLI